MKKLWQRLSNFKSVLRVLKVLSLHKKEIRAMIDELKLFIRKLQGTRKWF